jgi:uncharacterized protein
MISFPQLRPTILPVSSGCNLKCGYCYCNNSDFYSSRSQRDVMDIQVLEALTKKFTNSFPSYISFCWHGGEPLLAGKSFFNEVIRIQKKYKKGNQEINNRLQTNATLIDYEWAQFFKDNNFKIGISIDGPQWIHDQQRLSSTNEGTFSKILQSIEILRDKDINFSVLMTITANSVKYPDEIYKLIINQKFKSIKLNPCFGSNILSVNLIEYANFMNRIFDLWFNDDRDDIDFGHLGDIVNGLLGGKPKICHMRDGCYRHVKIDFNGDVLPCDTFLGNNFKFGNILHQEIDELINSENYKTFYKESSKILEQCSTCKYLYLCRGGCSRYTFDGSIEKKFNRMCSSRKIMYNHISKTLNNILIY